MVGVREALLVLLVVGTGLASSGEWAELQNMMNKARHRRGLVQTYFVNIYRGTADKCVPFPPPTTAEKIGEECLKGYDEGLDIALDWVRLSELSGKNMQQVQGLARCQEGYFTQPERSLSIVDRCTAKGIEDGVLYWYPLNKTPKQFTAQRRIIAKQNYINQIIKKLWTAMIQAKGQPVEVTVHSKVVSIPKGLFYPHPEGILLEHPSVLQKHPIELTHPVRPKMKPHPPVLGARPPSPQHLLFQKYLKELEQSDPAFQRSLSEDPQYKCQNNRVYTYHETVKGSLAKCERVLEFEQKAIAILSEEDPTLEELEFLNRVLFDLVHSCEVTKYALQEQNNPSLVRYTSLAYSQPLGQQLLSGSGAGQPLLI